jgi:hypothetical protein
MKAYEVEVFFHVEAEDATLARSQVREKLLTLDAVWERLHQEQSRWEMLADAVTEVGDE